MLEVARAGIVSRGPVVVMGGWVQPPAAGLPPWGPEMDFNVQWDTRAAEVAAASTKLTLVTPPGDTRGSPSWRDGGRDDIFELGLALASRVRAGDEGVAEARTSQGPAARASGRRPPLPRQLLRRHRDPAEVPRGNPTQAERRSDLAHKNCLRAKANLTRAAAQRGGPGVWLGAALGGVAVALGSASGVTEGFAEGSTVGLGSASGVTEGAAVAVGSADSLGAGACLSVGRCPGPSCWTWENVVPLPPDRACDRRRQARSVGTRRMSDRLLRRNSPARTRRCPRPPRV
jgi:hypothetical protein